MIVFELLHSYSALDITISVMHCLLLILYIGYYVYTVILVL